MRIAAPLAILLFATTAARADSVAPLSDAISAPTLEAAYEAAIRRDDTCQPHCAFEADRTLALPNGLRAAVRHQTNTAFATTGYVITFTSNDRAFVWSTADTGELRNPAVGVTGESSGMGKSLDEKLSLIDISTTKSMLFVRFVVASTHTHWGDPLVRPKTSSTTHLEYLIACRYIGATPACTDVQPVSHWVDTHLAITGPTTIRRNGETIAIR